MTPPPAVFLLALIVTHDPAGILCHAHPPDILRAGGDLKPHDLFISERFSAPINRELPYQLEATASVRRWFAHRQQQLRFAVDDIDPHDTSWRTPVVQATKIEDPITPFAPNAEQTLGSDATGVW